MKKRQALVYTFLLILTTPYLLDSSLAAPTNYEKPPILDAKSLLNGDLINGPHHSVINDVQNDGFFNHYTVKSEFGEFEAASALDLRLLVHEINVIAQLKAVDTDDTLVEGFKDSAGDTVAGVKHLFSDPKGTMERAGEGLSGLFNRAKGTIGKRELTDAEDNRIKQLIGISKAKGEIATKYGVNVYSRNIVLQKELNRLAQADFFGGLGVGLVKVAIPGAGGLLLTASDTARLLNETINTTPASKLWLQNKQKLLLMGVDADTIELFLNNPVFSPAQQTVLVTALEQLEGVANRELFLKVALQAGSDTMATVVTRIAVMSAGYHRNISKLKSFAPIARISHALGKDGSVIVFLPADHIIWSEGFGGGIDTLMERDGKMPRGAGFELWTLGDVSKRTQSELDSMGWKIHTDVEKQLDTKR